MPTPSGRYDRFAVGTELVGWVFGYTNRAPKRRSHALATGIEIGVQLSGDWTQHTRRTGCRVYRAGDVHVLWPGESYSNEYSVRAGPGLQVGFILYPDQVESLVGEGTVLVPNRRLLARDPRLWELCRAVRHAADRGGALRGEDIAAEVIRYVAANAHLEPIDPVLLAKQEIDRTFDRPLYMHNVGETAQIHPETLARRFRARFGLTPARYRVMLRLNEAARRCWARRDLTITEIASGVGFDDPSYFHRAFRSHFGMTPTAYRNRGRVTID